MQNVAIAQHYFVYELFATRISVTISREVGEAEWRIDDIMAIVEREISVREKAFLPTTCSVPTVTALVAGDGKPRCCYCHQPHSSVSCKNVTDIAQRKIILKKTGRCFVCLKRYHMSQDCCLSISCAHCNGRHHTSVCTGHVTTQPAKSQVAPVNPSAQTGRTSTP